MRLILAVLPAWVVIALLTAWPALASIREECPSCPLCP